MPPMVTGCPFLLQVTVVAGEAVEVHVRTQDELEGCEVNDVILGGAVGRRLGWNIDNIIYGWNYQTVMDSVIVIILYIHHSGVGTTFMILTHLNI